MGSSADSVHLQMLKDNDITDEEEHATIESGVRLGRKMRWASLRVIRRHCVSSGVIVCHQVSLRVIRCHCVPSGVIMCHRVSLRVDSQVGT